MYAKQTQNEKSIKPFLTASAACSLLITSQPVLDGSKRRKYYKSRVA